MKHVIGIMTLILAISSSLLATATAQTTEVKTLTKPSEGLIWAGCGITKKAFMSELAKAYETKSGIHINMQGGGATKGIRSVATGEINIGGACRTSMEFDQTERYVQQIPVAWDAIVFIVNVANPVNSITLEQVRSIYNGEITNWKQLGGKNEKIDLYVRKSIISGVGQTLRELVFNDAEKEFFKGAIVVKSTGPAEKAVEKSESAMTATGVSSAKRGKVKILQVSGHEPSYENIKAGKYILYRPLYLVTKMRETNPKVLDFIQFAQSEEGKRIIRKAGTVPYTDALHLLGKQYRQNLEAMKARVN